MAPSPRSSGESVIRFRGTPFLRSGRPRKSTSLSLSLSLCICMNSFRASVIAAEECHCRACFQRTLYTYVTSNESPPRTWNEISPVLSPSSILRFRLDKCPSFLPLERTPSRQPRLSKIERIDFDPSLIFASRPTDFILFFFSLSRTTIVREKERDRVIDGRDKLDTSSRQNCRAGSRTLELNFERN